MRKNIFINLVLCLCILLVSCDSSEKENFNVSDTSATNDSEMSDLTQETEDTFPFELDENNNITYAPDGIISTRSYAVYQEILKRVNIPDDFITYEDVSSLGEFESIAIVDNFTNILYCFTNGISLDIHLEKYVDFEDDTPLDTRPKDIRRGPPHSYYCYQGLYYVYSVNGDLTFTHWESEGVQYAFYTEYSPSDWPHPKDPEADEILRKFLIPEQAIEVVKGFAQPDMAE